MGSISLESFNQIRFCLTTIIDSSNHPHHGTPTKHKHTRHIVSVILKYVADLKCLAVHCQSDPAHLSVYQGMRLMAVTSEYSILIKTMDFLMQQIRNGNLKRIPPSLERPPYSLYEISYHLQRLCLHLQPNEEILALQREKPDFDLDKGNDKELTRTDRYNLKQYRMEKCEKETAMLERLRSSRQIVYWTTSLYVREIIDLRLGYEGINRDVYKTAFLLDEAYKLSLEKKDKKLVDDIRHFFRKIQKSDFDHALQVIDCLIDLRFTRPHHWHKVQVVAIEALASEVLTPSQKGQLVMQTYRHLQYIDFLTNDKRLESHNLIRYLCTDRADLSAALDESGRSVIDQFNENGTFSSRHPDRELYHYFKSSKLVTLKNYDKQDLSGPIFSRRPSYDIDIPSSTDDDEYSQTDDDTFDIFFT